MQAVSAFTILLGFCVNNRNLVIKEGWRKQCTNNQKTMSADLKKIDHKRETMTEFKAHNLDIGEARLVLQLEGPNSSVFLYEDKEKETIRTDMHHLAVKFEYYWVSLAFLMKNGGFIFSIQYLAFSM